jgi:hypothetical protein
MDLLFSGSVDCRSYRKIKRKQPPKGEFYFFDVKKPAKLRIQSSTAGYVEVFQRNTGGILEGLNWKNVFVAGRIALNTLVSVEQTAGGIEEGSRRTRTVISTCISTGSTQRRRMKR